MTKKEFFAKKGKHLFFTDAFTVAEYVNKNCEAEAAEIIATANDVADKRFLFNLRWDMERTWEHVVFDGEINWLYKPGDDPEWIYAFNRMRFWICLGQAYALTKDEKYAKAFVEQMIHWVRTVRPEDPKNAEAWRSIEVGLRLEYWLKAIRYFEHSPALTDDAVNTFYNSILEHAEFLMGIWNAYNLMSNWGVLANHGLFLAGAMLPDSPRTRKYASTAAKRLAQEIQMQVYRDGTHWEQSPMYHNEVLHCFLDVVLLAQRGGIQLPDIIPQKTRDMCYVDLFAAKPDHNEISMGDSDEIDQRDLISKGALLFGDGRLKSRGYAFPDFDTAWDIGEEGIAQYVAIQPVPLPECDRFFSDGGNMYLRSGWHEDATFLHFHCGPLGAGHGHADQLHLDLFSRGEDVLVDAGRFSYVFGPDRVDYKEAAAHNVTLVDEQDYYVCKDSWECADLTRGINQKFYADEKYGYAEGAHLAYMRGEKEGVLVNRRVIYLKPDIVVVADEFYATAKHNYSQLWHFNNAGTLSGEAVRYTYASSQVKAQVALLASGVASCVKDGKLSRHYNQSESNKVLVSEFEGSGFASAFTVFALSSPGSPDLMQAQFVPVTSNFKGITFEDRQVQALEIRFGKQHYLVAVAHEEYASPTDTFLAAGCTGFGSAVVFDKAAGETEIGTVLLW